MHTMLSCRFASGEIALKPIRNGGQRIGIDEGLLLLSNVCDDDMDD